MTYRPIFIASLLSLALSGCESSGPVTDDGIESPSVVNIGDAAFNQFDATSFTASTCKLIAPSPVQGLTR